MIPLAISNIAWASEEESTACALMKTFGYSGMEIAPSKFWADVSAVSDEDVAQFRKRLRRWDIRPVAMQALLYNRPELTLFEDEAKRERTLEHLKRCVDLSHRLGIEALVFGSPQNRRVPDARNERCFEVAVDFFHRIGLYAQGRGTSFCIEPNPRAYGTNFVCRTDEALKLAAAVDSKGFKINLDTGTVILNNEDYHRVVADALPHIGHVHVSEPFLSPIDPRQVIHRELSDALKAGNYGGHISIEMKASASNHNLEHVRRALSYVATLYG
jgi:D-psicose/D-tagatose/L-ribulose 3-epimerase